MLMGHMAKMKKGISKLVMLLLLNKNYLKEETSHKLNQPNKQSFVLIPEHASYQKDKLLLFILITVCLLGQP